MLRSPYGGVENVAEMRGPGGMEYLALNIGDYDSTEWFTVRSRADAAGIPRARVTRTFTNSRRFLTAGRVRP